MVSQCSILFCNIQSLTSHINSLRDYVDDKHQNTPSIIVLSETQLEDQHARYNQILDYGMWSKESPPSSNPNLSNRGTRGGGTAVYYKSSSKIRY